jgi:exopolyphosphatase/guanosine-5'-triphosphate,3'-diphosphate pyrophosphatase
MGTGESSCVNVCVIDVGSHTVRLLLACREGDRIRPLLQEKAAIGLGAEVERLGRLSGAKIDEAASLVGEFARIARKAGAAHVETLVTAPGRQSANGDVLVHALLEASGASVRVLTPDEEGRLAFSGAVHGSELEGESVGVCDVGGGSTEIVVGSRSGEPAWMRSVDVGALRLTRRLLDDDPPSQRALSLARLTVEREFASLTPPLPKVGLAAGGTARALRKLVGDELGPSELDAAIALLRERRSGRIARAYGIDRGRAQTLIAGALILQAVQCRLNVPLRVSRTGLREGAVLAMLDEAAEAA